MTNVGAAVASLGGGILTSLFGKKRVILAACLSFATGAAICAFSPNKAVLLVGRVILGFAIGITHLFPDLVEKTATCRHMLMLYTSIRLRMLPDPRPWSDAYHVADADIIRILGIWVVSCGFELYPRSKFELEVSLMADTRKSQSYQCF